MSRVDHWSKADSRNKRQRSLRGSTISSPFTIIQRLPCYDHTSMVRLTSDCRFLVLKELVPNEPHHETRLPDSSVPQQHQLEVAHPPRAHPACSFPSPPVDPAHTLHPAGHREGTVFPFLNPRLTHAEGYTVGNNRLNTLLLPFSSGSAPRRWKCAVPLLTQAAGTRNVLSSGGVWFLSPEELLQKYPLQYFTGRGGSCVSLVRYPAISPFPWEDG